MLEFDQLMIRNGNFRLKANDRISAGQVVGILGPSGSGKSTLINAIAGFSEIKSGAIKWNGADLSKMSISGRPISMIFQEHNLFPRLSLRKNIMLGNRNCTCEELESICEKLGIVDLLERFPRQVSGGQAARAALARAILQNSEIWLLDEPFSPLGPRQRREFRDLIAETIRGTEKLVLMVTHSPADLPNFAQQVVWIDNENVNKTSDVAEFLKNPPKDAQKYL